MSSYDKVGGQAIDALPHAAMVCSQNACSVFSLDNDLFPNNLPLSNDSLVRYFSFFKMCFVLPFTFIPYVYYIDFIFFVIFDIFRMHGDVKYVVVDQGGGLVKTHSSFFDSLVF